MHVLLNIGLVVFSFGYSVVTSITCDNNGVKWLSDPMNCSTLHMCFYGQEFKLNCPKNYVADSYIKSCVPRGSTQDKCSKEEKEDLTSRGCKLGRDIRIPHDENCGKYFTCQGMMARNDAGLEEKECPYPLLYDVDSKNCQHPDFVKCGNRTEPKDPCDYQANQCQTAHCTPCHVRFPSCRSLPNGLNEWRGREDTPYYVVCNNERVVYSDQCASTDKGLQIFSSKKKFCVEL